MQQTDTVFGELAHYGSEPFSYCFSASSEKKVPKFLSFIDLAYEPIPAIANLASDVI